MSSRRETIHLIKLKQVLIEFALREEFTKEQLINYTEGRVGKINRGLITMLDMIEKHNISIEEINAFDLNSYVACYTCHIEMTKEEIDEFKRSVGILSYEMSIMHANCAKEYLTKLSEVNCSKCNLPLTNAEMVDIRLAHAPCMHFKCCYNK